MEWNKTHYVMHAISLIYNMPYRIVLMLSGTDFDIVVSNLVLWLLCSVLIYIIPVVGEYKGMGKLWNDLD